MSTDEKNTLEIMGFSLSDGGIQLENDVEWLLYINFYKHFMDKMITCQTRQLMMR